MADENDAHATTLAGGDPQRGFSHQIRHSGQQAVGYLLNGQRKHLVIAPGPCDMDVARAPPLVPESQFLSHPQTGIVLGTDANLNPVQSECFHGILGGQRDRGWGDRAPSVPLVDPVSDGGVPGGAVHDIAHRALPDHGAGILLRPTDEPWQAIPLARLRPHRPHPARRIGRFFHPQRGGRVPWTQPRRVAGAYQGHFVEVAPMERC